VINRKKKDLSVKKKFLTGLSGRKIQDWNFAN